MNLINFLSKKNKQLPKREEDLKYLQFVKEVTDDIISRGITSNRVINNCFSYHIKKNKHLNETKMKELLDTLRKDIGVPDENGKQILFLPLSLGLCPLFTI